MESRRRKANGEDDQEREDRNREAAKFEYEGK